MSYDTTELELLSTIIYVLLTFLSTIIAVLGSVFILGIVTRHVIDVKEEIVYYRNVGIALVLGSFIWTLGRMCLEAVRPIMNVWYSNFQSGLNLRTVTSFTTSILLALLTALIIGAVTIYLSLKILLIINKNINEWEEIKQGNSAVAIIISVMVVVVGTFFESIVSYIVSNIIHF